MKKPLSVLSAVFLGLFFVACVRGNDIGLGWTLFCLLVTAVLLVIVSKQAIHSWHAWLMIAGGVGVALSHTLYAQDHLTPLNVLIAPLLVVYGMIVLVYGNGFVEGLISLFMSQFGKIFFGVKKAYNAIIGIIPKHMNGFGIPKIHKGIIGGLILGVGALIVLIPLLASADPVFSNLFSHSLVPIQQFFQWLGDLFRDTFVINKIIVFVVVLFVLLSMFLYFGREKEEKEIKGIKSTIDRTTYITMSCFIALIYIIFAVVQIKYLFLGSALPDGLTYSEYAVKGFWQLTGISLINIALIMLAPRYNKEQTKNIYLLLMRIIFLCSAIIRCAGLFRLRLYVLTYGLTFMRILPFTFIIYLGYGLIISFIGLWKHSLRRSNLLAYGLVIWYVVFQLMGVDTIIANYNIKRYIKGETSIMDVQYLINDLSWDQMRAEYNLKNLRDYSINKPEMESYVTQIDNYITLKGKSLYDQGF